jgi:hypothetical protein
MSLEPKKDYSKWVDLNFIPSSFVDIVWSEVQMDYLLWKDVKNYVHRIAPPYSNAFINDKRYLRTCTALHLYLEKTPDSDIWTNYDGTLYQLFFKTLAGKTVTYRVTKDTRIYDLKRELIRRENYQLNTTNLILMHAGVILQDESTLCELQICELLTIYMVVALKGD